jgi:isoquinoline 1-oxidoreductase alpha subunit
MSEVTLSINGSQHTIDVAEDMPLLWALRDVLNFTGTKYGCGIGTCGTCTVLVNGIPIRSCVMPTVAATGAEITTIEGLDAAGMHPVQRAWNDEDVPQCGYCQGGQILTAAALLSRTPRPSDGDINDAMSGVLCRCGTYPRIRKAIKRAADYMAEQEDLA